MSDNCRMIVQRMHARFVFGLSILLTAPVVAAIPEAQRSKIDQVTGVKGAYTADEDVYRVNFPRTDVKVAVESRGMHPFLGLTSWAAFTPHFQTELMVMGDLVLFEDEVNPVMSAALDAGLEVTAFHNHFFFDQPKAYFMHIGGEGETAALAKGVRQALDTVGTIRSGNPLPRRGFGGQPLPKASSITLKTVEDIFGVKGQSKDGMVKVVLGRKAKLPCGCEVGKEMGVNTWAAFAGSDALAVVDGDFAVLEDELQP